MAGEKRSNEMALELAAIRRKKQEAEAEGKFGNEISEALQGVQASPLELRVQELYDQLQAAKKPAKKKQEQPQRPRPTMTLAPPDNLGGGDVSPEARAKMRAHAAKLRAYQADAMRDAGVQPGAGGMGGQDVSPETRKKMRQYHKESAPATTPRVEASKRPAANATSDSPPDQALADIARMTPAEAMAEWSLIASTSGVTGKKTPREATILAALKAKRDQFDDSKVRQAPGGPYVPGFMRPK
jgi:hypothetical protein